jgi:protein-disulfide isomerase
MDDSNRDAIYMLRTLTILAGLLALLSLSSSASAQVGVNLPDRIMGKERTPVVIEEYVSLTCPHCADFYINVLPQLEKRYIKTGLVRVILRDFPLDAAALKAAALSRCMPAGDYFTFIRILFDNQKLWAMSAHPDKILIQYAGLGGLDPERATACINDPGMQSAIVAERAAGT